MLDELWSGVIEVGAVLSLLRGLETLGERQARNEGPPCEAGGQDTPVLGFRAGGKEPAHLLWVQASKSVPFLDMSRTQAPG